MADSLAGRALPPSFPLNISRTTWPSGLVFHRVHYALYGATEFHPGVTGNARFSPIRNKAGEPIPTLYGGASFECAAMETVFHDVPFMAGFKAIDKAKLNGQLHSQVRPEAGLVLADLGSKALRKLGIERKQLIDTEKDQYPVTRLWAEAIHGECPDVQGLCWTSRQDDSARAMVVFGDRLAPGLLHQAGASRSLVGDAACYGELLDLAAHIGVNIVPGRP